MRPSRCPPSNRYFYPRPPRGGRLASFSDVSPITNFYPRPPRGGRLPAPEFPVQTRYFYPRPPRGGRRQIAESFGKEHNFYPRPPRGGRQQVLFERRQKELISIHALRKEGDEPVFCRYRRRQGFLSTPSARRATRQSHYGHCQHEISIHALRKEGDPAGVNPTRKGEHFYPRPPQGGRPAVRSPKGTGAVFLSTPSARRATR